MADLKYTVDVDTKGAQRSLDGIKGSIVGIGASIAGAFTFKEIATISARFEDLRTTLGFLYGDVQTGAQAFEQIKSFASSSVFSVEDLTNSVVKLKSAGLEPTIEQLRLFADVSSVSTDSVGALQAITDLFARTTEGGLGLEDLNRLADRGIPVFQILADKLGITRLEVSELGKSAEGAQLILGELTAGLSETFSGASAAKAANLSQAFSNLQDAIANAADAFGQGGFNDALTDAINKITDFIANNQDLIKSLGEKLGAAISFATKNLKYLAGVIAGVFTAAAVGKIAAVVTTVKRLSDAFKAAAIAGTLLQGVTGIGLVKVAAGLAAAAGAVATINAMTETASEDIGDLSESFGDIEDSANAIPDRLSIDVDPNTPDALSKLNTIMGDSGKTAKQLNDEMKRLRTSTTNLISDLERSTADMKYEFESLNMDPLQRQIADIERDIQTRVGAQIKKLEESMTTENAEAITAQINRLKEAASEAIVTQTDLATQSTEYQRSFAYGWNQAFQQFRDDAGNAANAATTIFQGATNSINDAIDNFVETGKLSLKDLLQDIAKTAAKTVLKTGVNNFLSGVMGGAMGGQQQQAPAPKESGFSSFLKGIGGSIGNKLFGGLFANGGYLPAGQFGIVGERQAEMVMGPASIRPSANGGGAMNVVINAVDSSSFKALVARDPEFIYAVAQRGSRSYR